MDIREQIKKEVEGAGQDAARALEMCAINAEEALKVAHRKLDEIVEKYRYIADSMPLNVLEAVQNGAVMDIRSFPADAFHGDHMNNIETHSFPSSGEPMPKIQIPRGNWHILLIALPEPAKK